MGINDKIKTALQDIAPVEFQTYKGPAKTYITFLNVSEVPEEFADDEQYDEGIYVQVDIWCDRDYSELVELVRAAMKQAGLRFRRGSDFYEKGTGIYHKALEFYYLEV